ncbi:MAG: outer membrane lipoprotein carrier protein LolA [Alphaproteobacteria bacterium]
MKINAIILISCLILALCNQATAQTNTKEEPAKASATLDNTSEKNLTIQEKAKLLIQIEQYLNSLTTIKADFAQNSSNGSSCDGVFYLNRPGKMRIDYKEPMNVEIVADGRFLVYHDISLEQITYMNLETSPAGILLKDKIAFNDDYVSVKDVVTYSNTIEITLNYQNDTSAEVTLIFSKEPLALKQWRVLDAHSITTVISLYNVEKGINLDSSLFKFVDPRRPNPLKDRR